ncbi:MAG: DNA polymerase III subunit delta [Pseudomonadota bacterium]
MKLVGDKSTAFAAKPKRTIWAALAYCDDEGVANDAAKALTAAWVGQDDDAEIVSLVDDEIRKDPALLYDELEARSLLGGKRLIRVRTSGDKIAGHLRDIVELADGSPDRFEAKLVVTAGALQKKSKLRAAFEAAKTAASLQLFADELGDVSDLIRDTLNQFHVTIAEDAVSALATHLPGHRRMVHAELEKLALYALGLDRPLTVADVRKVCVPGLDASADAYVSAVFDRDLPGALDALDRLTVSGTSAITLIRALQRETQRLLAVASLGPAAGPEAGMKLRPPVFRSQWPALSRRAKSWPSPLLSRILERIFDLEYQAKQHGPIADTALKQLTVQMTTPLPHRG